MRSEPHILITQLKFHVFCLISELCAATLADVVIYAMVGGRDELRPLLFSAMIRAGALDGQLYVLEVIEQIVSIALWFKPGHMLWSS